MPDPTALTRLLGRARDGDADALRALVPLVYDELRALARSQRRRRGAGATVNTTALVHEAYQKLARSANGYADRGHFFRVAARAMREVLVDHARAQSRQKRGGPTRPLPLDEALVGRAGPPERVLALDEALARLRLRDPRQAEVVDLRYFVGLTIPETAEVLGLSPATVKRDWTAARAWLHADPADAP